MGALHRESNITLLAGRTAVDLLTLSHHSRNPQDVYLEPTCIGAYVFDQATGKVEAIMARETILATGGLGRIFLHTSNPLLSRGDGIAMAYRAGARCINMQYVQFHPTTLYHGSERFLLSESMRGEGARLVDARGREFMFDFHPEGSLAPRDVVARGIHQMMYETGSPCAYLDISHKPADWIRSRFPRIAARCQEVGIDITTQPIPVVPAAHYSCGGVAVDENGRSSMARLRAVGEVSCTGLHGANRLASTSLLECLVWGTRAGMDAVRAVKKRRKQLPARDLGLAIRDGAGGPGADRPGLVDDPSDHVELRRAGPQHAAAGPRPSHPARVASGNRAFLRHIGN